MTLTQHPELIGGAVIESPLVDMLRYHELPPGASWMGEYGDPRIPAEAAFIAKYSGYQNVKPDMKYPEVYITTNTRDDRVHPGHARKFAARLQATGLSGALLREHQWRPLERFGSDPELAALGPALCLSGAAARPALMRPIFMSYLSANGKATSRGPSLDFCALLVWWAFGEM